MKDWHKSQRGYFAGQLYDEMAKDETIWLVVGDLGYKMFDKHFKDFPTRCINVGAAEQSAVGVAVGLTLEGKRPFVYSITPFFLRAMETISLYLSGEQHPVILVGSGRDDDYAHDGISHFAFDFQELIGGLNIYDEYPETLLEASEAVTAMLLRKKPSFISLKR